LNNGINNSTIISVKKRRTVEISQPVTGTPAEVFNEKHVQIEEVGHFLS